MADKGLNIYFFFGPDTYRALKTFKEWKAAFETKHGQGTVTELKKADKPHRLSELAGAASLFNPTNMYVFKEPVDSVDLDDLFALIESGTKTQSHFLLWQQGPLDKRLTTTKKILELGKSGKIKVYEYAHLGEPDGLKFIAAELKKLGLEIKRDAAQLFFQFTSTPDGLLDAWSAQNGVNQLAAYAHGRSVVTSQDVQAVVAPLNVEDVFLPLLQAFARKDQQQFAKHLDTLVENTEAEQELLGIISALFEQIKNMLAVKEMAGRGASADAIDQAMGFKKGRSKFLLADSRKFEAAELEELLDKLIEIEYNIKQGKTVLAPAMMQLWKTKTQK